MQVVSKTPERIIVRAEMNYSLANAVRRSIDEVQTLAIDEVEFFKNDSALYDEYLAHRIGLVPLKTEAKMGAKTSVDLKIKKSGPCTIYSGDLEGNAKVVYKNMPLTILEKGQEIELVATAKLGTGLEHTKYVPGLGYYRSIIEVKSTHEIDKIVQESNSSIKPEKKGNRWLCDLNEAEIDEIIKIDKEAVKDTNEILFFVESFGQMDAETILTNAIEVLDDNLEAFEKALK